MRLGIMQPYFWPYLGYFQLMNYVDKMVIYDNIQYTKKGWFNRNRYLCNGTDRYFTVSIAKGSDFLDVRERFVADNFDREKLINQIRMAYQKAPYFENVFPVFYDCIYCQEKNLFDFIFYSIQKLVQCLNLKTEIIVSSSVDIDHELKGQDKVIAICKKLQAAEYINAIGGQILYDKKDFLQNDIALHFLKLNDDVVYKQMDQNFVPGLSILDVMMFNSREEINELLKKYTIV